MPVAHANRTPTISVQEADSIVRSRVRTVEAEELPLPECVGRILREEVHADRDFPPFDRVTMDGVAFSFSVFEQGRRSFRIEATQAAGQSRRTLVDEASCIEVMTGAMLPKGCDCVVPVEEISLREGNAIIDPLARVTRRQNVHRQGSDHANGDLLLENGALLQSPQIAVCATVGRSRIAVSRRLRVAIVSTGDELVGIEATPLPHQIRVSNSYALETAVTLSGCAQAELFHAPDRQEELEKLLDELLARFDILLVSGGVSAGRFDLVPPVLEKLGVQKLFHRVAQRPGYPLLFAVSGAGQAVFALPGNPVSSLISTHRFVLPFLRACCGSRASAGPRGVLAERYTFEPPRTLFLPVKIEPQVDGRLLAHPVPTNGSGDLAGLLGSDGFIELPAEQSEFAAGTSWPLFWWS